MSKRKMIVLHVPVGLPSGVSPEAAASSVRQLIDIGLDDARTTIEDGEGALEAAELATSLHIHTPAVVETAPASLDEARLAAVALLAPFLSRGEDGTHPEDVLNQTLTELLPRYDATRRRFLTPAERDILIRTIVDQKNQWQNDQGEEITEMVINGYWGYIDATDDVLMDRAFGESPSFKQADPALYTAQDVETMRQLLARPEVADYFPDPDDESDRDDLNSVITAIEAHLKGQRRRVSP